MKKSTIAIFGCFFIIFFFQNQSINAQKRTITGTVYDGITGKPFPKVVIQVKGAQSSAVSSTKGKYSITIPDSLKTVKFADFDDLDVMEIKNISTDVIDIYLSKAKLQDFSIEDMMKIKVITAGKQEQKISDIPASVVVISRKDIEAYGYQSLKEILSNTLGMYKIDNYQNVSFGVRGFFTNVYNRNIIFMINGVKQQQQFQNWNDLYTINLQVESIDRIEIVRGPAAIIYGNDAFFGAINIITHPIGKSIRSSATASYGSDNTIRSNIQLNSATENTTINLLAGIYHSDGRDIPFKPILDSVQRYDGVWIKNGTTKNYFKQNSAYFKVDAEHKGFYGNISIDQTFRNWILAFAPVYDTSKMNRTDNITRGMLGYRKKINDKFSFDINTHFESFWSSNNYKNGLVNPKIEYGITNTTTQSINTELITFYKPKEDLTLTIGAYYNTTPYCNTETDVPAIGLNRQISILNTPRISYSAFMEVKYEINEQICLFGGIRATKQNQYQIKNINYVGNTYVDTLYNYTYDKINVIPRLAAIYKFNPKNTIKLMYGQAISNPAISENLFTFGVTHPQLIPQKIESTEVNLSSVLSKRITSSLSIFHNRLNDLINRQLTTNSTGEVSMTFNNSGKMETTGGELQIIYKPIQNLMFDVSFSYQKTMNKLYDNEAGYSPNELAYLKAIYTIKKDIIFGLNSYYVGSMKSEWDNTPVDPENGNLTPKGRIYKTTPSYYNLSANIRFDNIFNSAFYFSLHAENLLNTDIYYAPTTINSSYLPKGTYETGIQVNGVIGLKF